MEFAPIFVIDFLVLFFLFVRVFLLFLIIPVLEKESRIFYSKILTFVNFNMGVPFSDGFLLLLFQFIKLSVIDSLFLKFLEQYFSLFFFLLFNLLFDVFLVFVLLDFGPSDSLTERYDWVWGLDGNLAVNFLQVNDTLLQMNLSWSV